MEGASRDQGGQGLTEAEGMDGMGIRPLKGCTPAWHAGGRRKNETVLWRQRKNRVFLKIGA